MNLRESLGIVEGFIALAVSALLLADSGLNYNRIGDVVIAAVACCDFIVL